MLYVKMACDFAVTLVTLGLLTVQSPINPCGDQLGQPDKTGSLF